MVTKFGTKLAITRLAKKILARFLHLKGVFGDRPSNAADLILPRPTLVAMATKFKKKMGYTSACTTNITKILASDGGAV